MSSQSKSETSVAPIAWIGVVLFAILLGIADCAFGQFSDAALLQMGRYGRMTFGENPPENLTWHSGEHGW